MSIGRVVWAPACGRLTRLIASIKTASNRTPSRMAHNLPQSHPQITQISRSNFVDELRVGMLKRHERDASFGPNNSADVAGHGELGCCVCTTIGPTQRRRPYLS